MKGILFIWFWIGMGLLNIPIMILVRNKLNRIRTHDWLEEVGLCTRYGPLLSIGIFFVGIKLVQQEKERKNILLEVERLKIKSRFEILDL